MGAMSNIVAKDARVEVIGSGFFFTEGPVWDAAQGCLYFSDIPANAIHQWQPDSGLAVFRTPSGKSNGLTRDREGRLLVCEHAGRRVSRIDSDGNAKTLASHYKGRRLNSPNDLVVKSDGSIYFTDPPYGLNPTFGVAESPELDFAGVYRVAPDGSEIAVLADNCTPNGLAFSPDEKRLYVADTEQNHLLVYDVGPDGGLFGGRVFASIPGSSLAPDGIKVDREGRVFVTGAGGVWILDPGGDCLGIIPVPELPANLAWGDADWSTLYITARTSVYRIRMETAGLPV
ncbi:SMP-30/gluconolactonase/LRE family protein [Pseudorhodoplanes sp.]|uniref:SMP-30/gluconolactonase/LRE family protein n=1 Tax=Pseudorhodoplanes sp. TaxID=1934341 RepID=UPI00391C7BB1